MPPVSESALALPLERLIADTLHHMEGLGYSPTYLRRCRSVWRTFATFVGQEANHGTFSEHLVTPFLASYDIPTDPTSHGLTWRQQSIRAIMHILMEFYLHGCYQRRRGTEQRVALPSQFQSVLGQYEAFCREHRRCQPGTMRRRLCHLTRFLHFLEVHDVQMCAAIEPRHLRDFVHSQVHFHPKTLAVIASDLRSFLRFFCMQNLTGGDLSPHVPKFRIPRDAQIPSVWRPEEVAALLAAVDRSTPKGKRDYAILLLACRLGLRMGDIRTLRLEQIHWDQARLDLVQNKTDEPLSLPLTEEIGQALIDYLKHGRPITPYREVFLRMTAPLKPFSDTSNFAHIITFYRQRAGIARPPNRRQGFHSLRSSLATRLLEADTPIEVIAAVLGHRSLESTQLYLKVDIETLRSVTLEVQEVSHD
jgi:site-specific recombinase XerD